MATTIKFPPSINGIQKTLDAQLLSGVTASMTLNNVTGIQDKTGVCVIDAKDTNGAATPAKREYIIFTGVSGSTLTGLTRNADGGGSDQDHAVGAIVQFVPDVLAQQAIIDALLLLVTEAGALDTTKVVDLTTAQTLTNKRLTSPKINEDVALASTATEIDNIVDNGATASSTTTFTNKTLTSPVINTSVSGTAVLDEDDMTSNSDTKLATQQSIKAYVDTYRGTVLYDNSSGTTSTVTLSSSAANYDFLDIFYKSSDSRYLTQRVYSPNGKSTCLFSFTFDGNIYIKNAIVSISTTSITFSSNTEWYKAATTSTGGYNTSGTYIYILKVIGYKQ